MCQDCVNRNNGITSLVDRDETLPYTDVSQPVFPESIYARIQLSIILYCIVQEEDEEELIKTKPDNIQASVIIPEFCTKYRSEAQKALCLKRGWSDFDSQAYYLYG